MNRSAVISNSASAPAANPFVAALAAPATWDIDDAHSSAGFKVRHLLVSHVRGQLGQVSGTVYLDEGDLRASRVQVSVDARGIDTREPKRDEHLRSADFLDVANHPTVTFSSTAVRPASNGTLEVDGELTIRGVTRPITLCLDELAAAVKDPWGNTKRGATARASLDRKDFGLVWNVALEAGGFVVGDRVDLEIEVELVKRPG